MLDTHLREAFFEGLTGLIEANIIARSNHHLKYYINPLVVFNGDRVTFAKTYVKKKKEKEEAAKNQLDLFDPLKIYQLQS